MRMYYQHTPFLGDGPKLLEDSETEYIQIAIRGPYQKH